MPGAPAFETVEPTGVARQAILDSQQHVYGYELLCRANTRDSGWSGPLDEASARVLDDGLLSIGLKTLTSGRKAFINLSTRMLLSDAAAVLPPGAVVLELLENIPADEATLDACRSLRERGYALALDDFVPGSDAEAFVPYASYVKVDLLGTPVAEWGPLASRLLPRGIRMLAEKVETHDAFERAKTLGYTLFQGYYFCRPATVTVRALSANQITQVRLLSALNQEDVRVETVADLLKEDPRLSHRVLRSVNSAAFALRREVHSIHDAVFLIGLDQIRKWASIWSLAGMNGGSPELVTMTLLRARGCELLGARLGRPDGGAEYFLLGLCSLLDVLLGCPMEVAIEEMPLGIETRDALLGKPNVARHVLDAVTHYKRGEWANASKRAAELGLDDEALRSMHESALRWVHQINVDGSAS